MQVERGRRVVRLRSPGDRCRGGRRRRHPSIPPDLASRTIRHCADHVRFSLQRSASSGPASSILGARLQHHRTSDRQHRDRSRHAAAAAASTALIVVPDGTRSHNAHVLVDDHHLARLLPKLGLAQCCAPPSTVRMSSVDTHALMRRRATLPLGRALRESSQSHARRVIRRLI